MSTGTFVILWVTHGSATDVHLGLVPCTTNTTPGGFDEQMFRKGGLKGALVVVVVGVVVVVTTTASTLIFSLGMPVPWLSFVYLRPKICK